MRGKGGTDVVVYEVSPFIVKAPQPSLLMLFHPLAGQALGLVDLVGGHAIPLHRLGIVLPRTPVVLINDAEVVPRIVLPGDVCILKRSGDCWNGLPVLLLL